ncbi:MAG: hypothetical protein M3N39_12710, partial [Pseudomonadota bacterium]|nr:hypothetical protein [Pseudomonadota bacterium]
MGEIMLAVALYAFAASAAPEATVPQPSPTEPMISTATKVSGAASKLARIWPGYWPRNQNFVLHAPGQGALLIGDGPAPSGFRAVPSDRLPRELQGRAFYHQGPLRGVEMPFVIDYPVGANRTAILVTQREGLSSTIGTMLHEQFHGFQRSAFKKAGTPEFVSPQAIADRPAFAATADTERILLTAALASGDQRSAKALLHQYLALRGQRTSLLPESVRETERGLERTEGTAQFAQILGQEAVFGGGEAAIKAMLIEALRSPLAFHQGQYMTIWFRNRSYSVGAAMSYLLDSLGTRNWRSRVQAGAALDTLLAERVGFDRVKHPATLAEAARLHFGYEERLARLRPGIAAAEKAEIKSVDEFYALAPYRVVFEPGDPIAKGGRAPALGFSTEVMAHLSTDQLALPRPQLVNVSGSAMTLTVRNRPFLSDSSAKNRRNGRIRPDHGPGG